MNKGLLVVPDACVKTTRTVKNYHAHTRTPKPESDTMRESEPTKQLRVERKDVRYPKPNPQKLLGLELHIWLAMCHNQGCG